MTKKLIIGGFTLLALIIISALYFLVFSINYESLAFEIVDGDINAIKKYENLSEQEKAIVQESLVMIIRIDSDPIIRKKALKYIIDTQVLLEVAASDPNYAIRDAAVSKITDIILLSQIAENALFTTSVRKIAMEKLPDGAQRTFIKIIKQESNNDLCESAIPRINDSATLNELVQIVQDQSVRSLIVEKLTDQETLLTLANDKHEYENIRKTAIQKLNDIYALDAILKERNFPFMSNLENVTAKRSCDLVNGPNMTQNELYDIVTKCFNVAIRRSALERIVDQNLLAEIATAYVYEYQQGSVNDLRGLAFNKITNVQQFETFALKHSDPSFRAAALDKIKNPDVIAEVAKKDYNENVRMKALNKLPYSHIVVQDYFAKVLTYPSRYSNNDRKIAIENTNNQAILLEAAKNDKVANFQALAVSRMTDPNILLEFATKNKKNEIRAAAIRKLKDQVTLEEILKNEKALNCKCAAIDALVDISIFNCDKLLDAADKRLLRELSKNSTNLFVKEGAKSRLQK